LRICYISKSSFPTFNASSLQIVKMCENLSSLNNQVFLIAPDAGDKNLIFKDFYNLKNRFEFVKLKLFKKFPKNIYAYIFSFFSVIYSLRFRPHLYISRNIIIAFILFLFRKKQIVELHHDIAEEGRLSRYILKFYNFLNSKNIIKVVVISDNLKCFYVKNYNLNNSKIQILPSASDIKIRKFYFANILKKKKFNIGYFGSFLKSKGVQLIINLAKIDRYNDYFIIWGQKEMINKIKLKYMNYKNLYFVSHLPHHKANILLSSMDILLLPFEKKITTAGDVGDITNFTSPLKLFDYLSLGKVILSSDIKVLKEILKNNVNCIFVRNFISPKSWLNEIKKLRNNIFIYNIISRNSLIIAKRYTYYLRAYKIIKY